jgi:hypothetical protein
MVDRVQTFINSPSRNHLVLSSGCLEGLKYIDVGFVVSCFIEDIIGDRRLSMRVQDYITKFFREHIFQSDSLGQYLALSNVGILFEPALKLDVEVLFDRWSQDVALFIDKGKGVLADNRYYLTQGCTEVFSVPLASINHIVLS